MLANDNVQSDKASVDADAAMRGWLRRVRQTKTLAALIYLALATAVSILMLFARLR
jgi:hypothetical protein